MEFRGKEIAIMKRIAIFGLLLGLPLLAQAAAPRMLSANIPATGINTLAITVGVGELRITPSTDKDRKSVV